MSSDDSTAPPDSAAPGITPLRESARRTLRIEEQAIAALLERLDSHFDRACELMLACQGRVVVTGMGKSGHVAGKIAATLASTGTPSFFVHPGEASHGDLGMITPGDVVLALSNSGETAEVTALLPLLKRIGTPLISMTGRPDSTLARHADAHLDAGVEREACPLDLAPTASTTAALALGDALAVALLEARGFTAEDFALSHPGGSLGKRLLLRVSDLMHQGERLPSVPLGSPLRDALLEITRQGLGFTCVVDEHNRLIGVYTDGDLRRTLDQYQDLSQLTVDDVMTRPGKRIAPDVLAAEAVRMMEDNLITALAVVDEAGHPIGALHMHDLLRSGVI
ncbi:KpsF/GutQ family sugar-phosphate isomerase [Halomonas sp. MCCC 1A17488]|uniref:Arabinose 5-phosphate isomerase n=1 Tax=Billgrantia sulfidoxydans TaxID=2733484 RepID=A0ABX7W6Q6_9GAMM|nr:MULTISPECIES: KpsF/GutQ family sugar-phosphate isomerase [Halomonas]MCE8014614.1 KpsF/GutQ family sugar-phosphate isomerase [Halomonas sp. MCCC 1A17488]MCG3237947.1 KpsF/GutQ family sugar-phosphate isomerase [Halomonas sp. MCCC 1A17488]QTP55571.1 KpsF/GutQ family sugar-phosphate isomerase [Halomonas sulfidoxydans]